MARQGSARHRRHRRFTPRRWLPFVALTALVVGAVMVSSEDPSTAPAVADPATDTSRLPAVTASDALSTAWFCSGGTANPEDGIANLSLVLANDADVGAVAEVTLYDEEGNQASEQLDVPANGRARLAAADVLEAAWVGALVEVRGGRVAVDREVVGPLGFDAGPCTTAAADHWYVASGSTIRGAEEYLSLFNPFPDTASVNITFATNSGGRSPRALRALSVPGHSVRVVKVSDSVTDRAEIAATITSRSGRVIVDRVQTYDGEGDPLGSAPEGEGDEEVAAGPSPKGLVSTGASPVLAPRWVFPGVRVSAGVTTQLAIFNPGKDDAPIEVVLTYQDPQLNEVIEPVTRTIRAKEQLVLDLSSTPGLIADRDLWVDVRSTADVPIVAERLSWFSDPAPRRGATATLGSPLAATRWMVTQGGATRERSSTVQVLNPGTAASEVTIWVLSGGDRNELRSAKVTIEAGDRRSLVLDDAGAAATVIVESTQPVVVASSLSFTEGPGISVQPAFPYPESVVALAPPG